MISVNGTLAITVAEWAGVSSSLAGSLLNARGKKISFVFWSASALLLGVVAFHLHRPGWLALQAAGIGINIYGHLNWKGDAPMRGAVGEEN